MRLVAAQFAVTIAIVCVALVGWGAHAAWSAAAGGAACAIPNGLFALRLVMRMRKTGRVKPADVLIGELLKLASTCALLVIAAWGMPSLSWPWFIGSIVMVLKSYLWVLLWQGLVARKT
ncbi:MAG TPA: ATP synthase subunit I [Burkholderiaceae bacterium]|nr:ATP synthase subunit I [Burkholderiaceae bacterium]